MFGANKNKTVIIHLQAGMEIAFFYKFEYFGSIALIKISLKWAVFWVTVTYIFTNMRI